jgi:hypothetical protein
MLVIGGLILLLESIGILEGSDIFWIAILGITGILFLVALATNPGAWWAAIPGVCLLGIALGIGLGAYTNVSGGIIGAVILGGIGASFVLVYLLQRSHWWAIIPGGVLITLAIVAGMEGGDNGLLSGGIFLAGLGLTFALVALLPNQTGRMTWAWIPAGILLLLAGLVFANIGEFFNYIWPVALILGGGFLLWRAMRGQKKQ